MSRLLLGILLEALFISGQMGVIHILSATCIKRNNLSVETKAKTMADQKNQNNQNSQNAPNKGEPMTEQQKQAAETERKNHAPGSQEKQPGAPGGDTDKK
ncbi:hypothetical protein HNE_3250 [Hyphomonas neptunium ATCC 15444]|uniref:Uncharacterized protein n=1 Tax=Hyphomonas neptunium (strain ATCC 15444) TaxID=228405 RepID=Q0BX70_HYPNA|nr:hypothetical protein HNE_3250 [Hyphomonas neptunium ATCC 15444]